MKQIIQTIILTILLSLFFFPFELKILPGVNTKMAMAAVGVVLIAYHLAVKRSISTPPWLFELFAWGSMVSLVALFSVIYNQTPDYTYASYLVSMCVWLSAAYTVCTAIKYIHGYIDMLLLTRYLAIVCVTQCMCAILIDNSPNFENWVNSNVNQLITKESGRLYGIGASLDVAGSRFSCTLILIACVVSSEYRRISVWGKYGYWLAFAIIFVCGCMIGRTTSIGMGISLLYLIFFSGQGNGWTLGDAFNKYKYIFVIAMIAITLGLYFYHNNEVAYQYMRFAFEGFFNWIETGKWETHSTNILQNMYVFPDNLKTWIIGDGYFNSPYNDIFYTGDVPMCEYYMCTDVGYLRFIFYFGICGLFTFMAYFVCAARIGIRRNPSYRIIFYLLLLCNFIIWFKVATDVFLVFALLSQVDSREEN